MAKGTHHGFAKPDDPIYSGGLTIGGRRLQKSTTSSPAGTDGTKPETFDEHLQKLLDEKNPDKQNP